MPNFRACHFIVDIMDWQQICRICLNSNDVVSLFDWDEKNVTLGAKYTYCCGIQASKTDLLPTLICLNCVDKLTISYQFKQQCISSNETLKECLEEFQKNTLIREPANIDESTNEENENTAEVITIKQEDGLLMQYELPVECSKKVEWTTTLKVNSNAVVTRAPGPRTRGRPRKYPNEHGEIALSPYQKKNQTEQKDEPPALTTLVETGVLKMKQESDDEAAEEIVIEFDEGGLDIEKVGKDPQWQVIAKKLGARITRTVKKKRGRPPKAVTEATQPVIGGDDTIKTISKNNIKNIQTKQVNSNDKKKYVYEKTHICETCGSAFTSNASLQAHIRRHLGIKPFLCSICDYACVLNMELRRHMMRHTGVRPYKCRICDRRFGDYGSRQKHERLHMGVRPYACKICLKSFTYSYVLANHMLTHTGVKNFKCEPCNKKFTKAHHLKYHNEVHHNDIRKKQMIKNKAVKISQTIKERLLKKIPIDVMDGIGELVQTSDDDDYEGELQLVEEVVEDEADIAEEVEHEADIAEEVEVELDETVQAIPDMQAVTLDSNRKVVKVIKK